MRFHIQGQSYQFKALPFGLSTAPMVFTVVAKEVKLMALRQGIRIHQYLDDWLVRASTLHTCLQHTQTLVSFSSSNGVSNPGLQQDCVDSYRQNNSGCLYQQRRGVEVGVTVCPTVENPVLVHQTAGNPQGTSHPRPAERDSRQAIQT